MQLARSAEPITTRPDFAPFGKQRALRYSEELIMVLGVVEFHGVLEIVKLLHASLSRRCCNEDIGQRVLK